MDRVRFKETPESIQEGDIHVSSRTSLTIRSLIVFVMFQEFACNGTLVDDEEMGQVIQLQGDQRVKISNFLTEEGVPKATIKLHGF
jgi:translation initiation factor SUI1